MPKPAAPARSTQRDASRDAFDARDLIYTPALVELPLERLPRWEWIVPLDQKNQGACTGFGLAAVINYQLAARRQQAPTSPADRVSARMLFQMAKRFDQWAGEKYDWSSARGAMKGWFKTGVCAESAWPNQPRKGVADRLDAARQKDALRCPLGAYYRVLPRRSDVHAALVEAGTVYVAADTHAGWDDPQGTIDYNPANSTGGGGHAFAIVGYTEAGFLVQNSWGPNWGGYVADGKARPGVALWTYADFDRNVWDLWVARLALPVESLAALAGPGYQTTVQGGREKSAAPPAHEIARHYLHIDDGQFDPRGDYPSSVDDIDDIVRRLVRGEDGGEPPRHIVLYAHGGLNTVSGSATRCQKWKPVFAANGIAELHFIWETGFLAELRDVLLGKEKFVQARVAGPSEWWDDWVEKASQPLGYPLWQEMLADAERAFVRSGAGRQFVNALVAALAGAERPPTVHFVGHSAGAVWTGHLLDAWRAANGPAVANLLLFAPACTVDFFFAHHAPALAAGSVAATTLFQLDDATEGADNVALIYRKSLLYLVSRAFQKKNAVVPLLGMEKYADLLDRPQPPARLTRVLSGHSPASAARTHGGFDNDAATMNELLRLVLGHAPARPFAPADLKHY